MSNRDHFEELAIDTLATVAGGATAQVWANPGDIHYEQLGHGNAPTADELKLAKQHGSVFDRRNHSWQSAAQADAIRSSFQVANAGMQNVKRLWGH